MYFDLNHVFCFYSLAFLNSKLLFMDTLSSATKSLAKSNLNEACGKLSRPECPIQTDKKSDFFPNYILY